MKCPFCAAEINPDALICNSCDAFRVTRRTTIGVVTGSLAIIGLVLMFIMWLPVVLLPMTTNGLVGYPWPVLAIGTLIVIGLLWHTHTSRRTRWVRMRDDAVNPAQ